MKLSFTIIALCLLSGCSKPDPVAINETAHYSGEARETSLFSGKTTTYNLDFDLTVKTVLLARNSIVNGNEALIMVLVDIVNTGKESLSIPEGTFVLKTSSGKTYKQSIAPSFASEDWPRSVIRGRRWKNSEVQDLGPDAKQSVLFYYRVPFRGFDENVYLATAKQLWVNLGRAGPDKWEIYESFPEVNRIYYWFR